MLSSLRPTWTLDVSIGVVFRNMGDFWAHPGLSLLRVDCHAGVTGALRRELRRRRPFARDSTRPALADSLC